MTVYKNKNINEVITYIRPIAYSCKSSGGKIKEMDRHLRLFDLTEVQKSKIKSRILSGVVADMVIK